MQLAIGTFLDHAGGDQALSIVMYPAHVPAQPARQFAHTDRFTPKQGTQYCKTVSRQRTKQTLGRLE